MDIATVQEVLHEKNYDLVYDGTTYTVWDDQAPRFTTRLWSEIEYYVTQRLL